VPFDLGFVVQPIRLDLRLGPGASELDAERFAARKSVLYEAYLATVEAGVEMVYNLILCHALS
jgi:hypothetical protein